MQKMRSDGNLSSGIQSTRPVFLKDAFRPRKSAMRSRLKLLMSLIVNQLGTFAPPMSMPLCGVA